MHNFKIVPAINPQRAPKAILTALFFISIFAPIYAPIKAPIKVPNGGIKSIPNNIRNIEPLIAYLPPPA